MILRDMIDTVFSHNALVAIWENDKDESHYSDKVWDGMAHNIPARFLDREATVFGAYGFEDGYINIHLEDKYKKPTVDILLRYAYSVATLYNHHKNDEEDIVNGLFGKLEAIRYIVNNILKLPFMIIYDENDYITSISIGSKTKNMKREETDD